MGVCVGVGGVVLCRCVCVCDVSIFLQTWEDPAKKGFNGTVGDNDPLDVMELGGRPCKVGEVRTVKILGDFELIDQVRRFR